MSSREQLESASRTTFETVALMVVIFVAVELQATVVSDIRVLGGAPDVVVVLVVAIGLLRGPVAGAIAGFAAGLLLDAVALGALGSSSIVLVATGYGAGVFGEQFRRRATFRPLLAVAIGTVAASVGQIAIALLLGTETPVARLLVISTIPAAALNVLVAILVFPPLRRLLPARTVPAAPAEAAT